MHAGLDVVILWIASHSFVPLAVETTIGWCIYLGNWGGESQLVCIIQGVSVAIQRGNAASILGTFRWLAAIDDL